MNAIRYLYGLVLITTYCYGAADYPELKSEISPRDQITEITEVSPRDQELGTSPRQKFLGKFGHINLRKAIANSSPRRTESPRKKSSHDGIEITISESSSKDNSPREIESPRGLGKSKSFILSCFKDDDNKRENKTLKTLVEMEKAGSPRGEEQVVAMLRAGLDRRKSAPTLVVDFQRSSPPISHMFGDDSKSSTTDKHEANQLPTPFSEEDQKLLKSGLFEPCPQNEVQQWQQTFKPILKELVTNHEKRELAKLSKEDQKEEESV